jgi:hypothetical protein
MKKTLHFATLIDAPRRVVWDTMLGSETYRKWTSAFTEGSYFEGSWDAGRRIHFLAPDGTGLVSEVAENRPYERVSVKHLGELKDGVEDTSSPQVRAWAPSFETYTFAEKNGSTEVQVDLDVAPEWEKDMAAMWPKALAQLKTLCESATAR